MTPYIRAVCCEYRYCFDADPDPNFHFDANPHADPTPSFTHTHVGKSAIANHVLATVLACRILYTTCSLMCLGVHVLGLQPGRVRLQVHHQPEGHEQGAGGGQVHLCSLDQLAQQKISPAATRHN